MWNFASHCIAGNVGQKNDSLNPTHCASESSDDEASTVSREEGLECPICWESFNIVENVPYVLWCGHTLCKNCILGLQWAVVKFPTLPVQLPLFISCPWCNLLSFRLIYRGNLKFPRKNYFLLWMVESMNGERAKSNSSFSRDHQSVWPTNGNLPTGSQVSHGNLRRGQHIRHPEPSGLNHNHGRHHNHLSMELIHSSIRKSLVFFVHLTAKFPLVVIFLLIVLYAIPASAAILALYILVTVLFALPSFLVLYFAYPSLDWLVREIITWHAYYLFLSLQVPWVEVSSYQTALLSKYCELYNLTTFHSLRLLQVLSTQSPSIPDSSKSFIFRIISALIEYGWCDGCDIIFWNFKGLVASKSEFLVCEDMVVLWIFRALGRVKL